MALALGSRRQQVKRPLPSPLRPSLETNCKQKGKKKAEKQKKGKELKKKFRIFLNIVHIRLATPHRMVSAD